jgi:hypothetical protein
MVQRNWRAWRCLGFDADQSEESRDRTLLVTNYSFQLLTSACVRGNKLIPTRPVH